MLLLIALAATACGSGPAGASGDDRRPRGSAVRAAAVSEEQAVAEANAWWNQPADRIETMFRPNGSETHPGPYWSVFLIGGEVCVPVFGGMNTPDDVPRCATRWIAVAVDAESGTVLGGGSGGSLAAALDRP